MNRTTHLNLKKPGGDDFYNIEDHNYNMDVLDEKVHTIETASDDHYKRQLNTSVPRSAWGASSYPDWPYKADVTFEGCTSDYVVDVIYGPELISAGIFAPFAESKSGKVTIYATSVPPGAISIPVIELRK